MSWLEEEVKGLLSRSMSNISLGENRHNILNNKNGRFFLHSENPGLQPALYTYMTYKVNVGFRVGIFFKKNAFGG